MNFQLNGNAHQTKTGTTISALLKELQLQPDRVVIELNHTILANEENSSKELKEGDTLEIIHFVGGG